MRLQWLAVRREEEEEKGEKAGEKDEEREVEVKGAIEFGVLKVGA